jgi:hypothetical protein
MGKGRISFVILALAAVFPAAVAAKSQTAHMTVGANKWFVSRPIVEKAPEGRYEMRILKRMIWAGKDSFYAGTVTYISYPRSTAPKDFNLQTIGSQIGKAMGINEWRHRKQGGSDVWEGVWKNGGRYLRFFAKADAARIQYSYATFRMGYAESVLLESELIQRKLMGEIRGNPSWLDHLVSFVSIPTAIAGDCAPCVKTPTTTTTEYNACLVALSNCSQTQLTTNVTSANNSLPVSSQTQVQPMQQQLESIQSVGQTVANSNIEGSDGVISVNDLTGQTGLFGAQGPLVQQGQISANSAGTIANGINNLSSSAANNANNLTATATTNANQITQRADRLQGALDQGVTTAQQAVQTAQEGSDELHGARQDFRETKQELYGAITFKNIFLASASAAAGASIGGLAITLISDAAMGLAHGIAWLFQAGERRDAEILERFAKARDGWEKTENVIKDLERAIDNVDVLNQIAAKLWSKEAMIQFYAETKDKSLRLEFLKEQQKELMKQYPSCEAERKNLAYEAAKIEEELKGYEAISEALHSANGSKKAVCNNLHNSIEKLAQAEGDLQRARAAILAGQFLWMKKFDEENGIKPLSKDLAMARKNSPKLRKLDEKAANDMFKVSVRDLKRAADQAMGLCIEKRYTGGVPDMNDPDYSAKLALYEKAKEECGSDVAQALGGAPGSKLKDVLKEQTKKLETQKEQQLRDASVRDEERSLSTVRLQANTDIVSLERKAYIDWFKRLSDDQKCTDKDCDTVALIEKIKAKGVTIDKFCEK